MWNRRRTKEKAKPNHEEMPEGLPREGKENRRCRTTISCGLVSPLLGQQPQFVDARCTDVVYRLRDELEVRTRIGPDKNPSVGAAGDAVFDFLLELNRADLIAPEEELAILVEEDRRNRRNRAESPESALRSGQCFVNSPRESPGFRLRAITAISRDYGDPCSSSGFGHFLLGFQPRFGQNCWIVIHLRPSYNPFSLAVSLWIKVGRKVLSFGE
jgi:hypothetical protein